jgi:hypothetical protein
MSTKPTNKDAKAKAANIGGFLPETSERFLETLREDYERIRQSQDFQNLEIVQENFMCMRQLYDELLEHQSKMSHDPTNKVDTNIDGFPETSKRLRQFESEPELVWEGPMGSVLRCPCGAENLHWVRADMFVREQEDGPVSKKTYAHPGAAAMQWRSPSPAPTSPRRQSVLLSFACEQCGKVTSLSFAQHKGLTFVRWLLAEEVTP